MDNQTLVPFCLKLDRQTWDRINSQRSQRMGITNPDPVTKTQFLREAIGWYCDFVDDRYTKRYDLLREIKLAQEEDTPLEFYSDDGRESSWL
jgi:hypothetical protein|tara:strand:+ start:419 stop:694 length:276 start_codon:yes stop_codon:yes gene_type:complete